MIMPWVWRARVIHRRALDACWGWFLHWKSIVENLEVIRSLSGMGKRVGIPHSAATVIRGAAESPVTISDK